MLKTIQDIHDLKGKRVLLRVDFNVSVKNGIIMDDFRIQKTLPTIFFLQDKGAKIIILSHIGREPDESLAPIAHYLVQNIGLPLTFVPEITGKYVENEISQMEDGEIIMLENLRKNPREVLNDETFARDLATLGDVYINEAFAVSHRNNASIVGVPRFLPSYAGFRFVEEMKELGLGNNKHPFLVILGGAKLETKMALIEKYLNEADEIFVAGALANEIYRSKGYEIGQSFSEGYSCREEVFKNQKVHYPFDVVVSRGENSETKLAEDVKEDESIVDIGVGSLENLKALISQAKRVLWNGPLGKTESGFDEGTKELLYFLSEAHAEVVIGGGDTVEIVERLGLVDSFSFVSTGGGAMLEYLERKTLVGIEALEENS